MMPGFGRTGFGRYNLPRFTPLVNVYITMDNHHVSWVNQLCLWPCSIAFCMFTGGYNPIRSPLNHHKIPLNPIKPPFSYGKSPFFRRGGSYCFPTTVTSTVQPSLRRSSHLDLLGLLRCAGSLLRSVPARPAVPWEQICRFLDLTYGSVSKPCTLVNIKIAGKWMFIPLKMVLIGIDPYPYSFFFKKNMVNKLITW